MANTKESVAGIANDVATELAEAATELDTLDWVTE